MLFEKKISGEKENKKIILTNTQFGTEAEIFCFGAALNAFRFKHNDKLVNVIDGYKDPTEASKKITEGFKSSKLSPFVGRLNNGEYNFDGDHYKVEKFYLEDHALHGLLYDAVFELTDSGADNKIAFAEFDYTYNKEDKGFPIPYNMHIRYALDTQDRLTITTRVTNKGKVIMPITDGWHPYFTFQVPVDDCTLQIRGENQIELDQTLIPTNKKVHDDRFLNPCLLDGIQLDNCFELSNYNNEPRCYFRYDNLTLAIEPGASYPFLQVYTPKHRNSIALENISSPPDAFNNNIGLMILQPEEEKVYSTSFRLVSDLL